MDVRESISNQTDVGLSLTKHVALTEAKDSNLFLSPSSTRELLSLITAGSRAPPSTSCSLFSSPNPTTNSTPSPPNSSQLFLPTEARAAGPAYPQPMVFGLISHFLSGILSNRLWTISTRLLLIKSISKPRLLKYIEK